MKKITTAMAAAALVCAAGLARAQDYPTAPVHVISGFPPAAPPTFPRAWSAPRWARSSASSS